jgi:hypothetical protein
MASERWASGGSGADHDLDPRRPSVGSGAAARTSSRRLFAGGTAGNEQLTAATGALLVVLLAALGVTILRIRPLLGAHMFIGLLLMPPVLLKMASTGYRFLCYYIGSPSYGRKGPPAAALRVLAPAVVLSTVVVFATGVALLLLGPSSRGSLLAVHKASFLLWLGLTAIHVLGHLPELPRALKGGNEHGAALRPYGGAGGAGRLLSLAGVLVAGVVLAVLYIPQFTPWLHAHHFAH